MEKTCKIYYTSDTHGRLFPEDGVGGRCLSACFAEYAKDENTLVLDGGDTLQGAPLLRYLWKQNTCPEVLAKTMNHGQLDYYTLGNHDFNYGDDALARYVQASNAVCVCANVQDVRGQAQAANDAKPMPTHVGQPSEADRRKRPIDIRPYAIHTLGNGLRIGIVGVVTEYVNLWEAEENLNGLVVTDPFAAAKEALKQLKAVENNIDYTICIYHGGFEEDITPIAEIDGSDTDADTNMQSEALAQHGERTDAAPAQASDAAPYASAQAPAQPAINDVANLNATRNQKPQENVGCKICRELNFDLLLTAHQHMEQPLRMLHGTAVLQLPPNADKYACLEIGVDVPDDSVAFDIDKAASVPRVGLQNLAAFNMDKALAASPRTRIIRAVHIAPTAVPDPAFLTQMKPVRTAATHWLARPAGSLAKEISPEVDKIKLALGEAPIAQLANFAQLKAAGAEVAITALPNQTVSLPKDVTIGDVLTAYPFPNAVMTLAVRGDILAKGIARSASYFAKGADGDLQVARDFVSPKEEHYNYDFFAGVEYTISFEGAKGGGVSEQMIAPNEIADSTKTEKAEKVDKETWPCGNMHGAYQSPVVTGIMVNGAPLDPARTYTVAMSDYRATGTGGYDFYAACPRVASYPVDLQELILETLAAHPNLRVPAQSAVHLLAHPSV